ncbi:MAG: hypothetical protein K2X10_09215 [Hyphomicrobiales bacterium]|nr:hypothetical protein [Hyphomicrobiales bacterium]
MARQPLSPEESARRLRQRNMALAYSLVSLVILFFIITLVKGVPLLNRAI